MRVPDAVDRGIARDGNRPREQGDAVDSSEHLGDAGDFDWRGRDSIHAVPATTLKARFRAFGRILLHVGLFVATAVTTTLMGTLLSIDVPISDDAGIVQVIATLVAAALG